ncbi:hypothetical protein Emtol_1867 [Emticicia oligotrophica DSM 17448]|uniref:Uncharacterized protein n=1 Tax=Emticicia oligotrophica (strain DSM 17448 / CIP 109782 / MTCC 6937 / GPTSA100-15) TaxID=929562 RepID=A0ABM5N125_EMTOG|nr:hypothetical protein [Emticicia oligotrophica]AFK03009.1 hypothetical protein Emtol_1867 [Emticicia oligotrophica DSM 17448]
MIIEGRLIENEFGIEKPFSKDYLLFEYSMVISEYPKSTNEETFFYDLKSALNEFIRHFFFFNVSAFEGVDYELFLIDENKSNEPYSSIVDSILSKINYPAVNNILNMSFGTTIIIASASLQYESIEKNFKQTDNKYILSIYIDNKNIPTLILGIDWNFGAEWFYNEYKIENRAIVRKAIIDFYESNPNYKELKIDYQLYGFDLELEKYTSKEVIVKKNLG